MPFNDKIANDVYELSTKPVCMEFGLDVQRADEIFTSNPILEDIEAALVESAVIIADISGKNPNVFYELGISHMLKRKQTIMITHEEYEGIPFDVSHFRIIKYQDTISGKTIYENQLRSTLKNILRNYKLIYRDDFEVLINFLSSDNETELYGLMALTKAPYPLHKNGQFHVEGHIRERDKSSASIWLSTEEAISNFIKSGFAEVLGDLVILTDKGKAFVEVLEEKGFVCDVVNGHILSEGYIPKLNLQKQGIQKNKSSIREKQRSPKNLT